MAPPGAKEEWMRPKEGPDSCGTIIDAKVHFEVAYIVWGLRFRSREADKRGNH